jgi:tripartite-type tricarboxylate transporter receptor subunit TctC
MALISGSNDQTVGEMMRKVLSASLLVAVVGLVAPAQAQTYPTKPITIVVPFAAGGPSDAMMRILGERMKVALGETILVENTTGAGGSIGVGRVAHAPVDG